MADPEGNVDPREQSEEEYAPDEDFIEADAEAAEDLSADEAPTEEYDTEDEEAVSARSDVCLVPSFSEAVPMRHRIF